MKKTNGVTASRILGEQTQKKSIYKRASYSLSFLPLEHSENTIDRPDIICFPSEIVFAFGKPWAARSTNNRCRAAFMLNFKNTSMYEYVGKPEHRRFLSYKDFLAKSEENQLLAFLRDCTNLTRAMFDAAYENPYCQFIVSVDLDKYLAKVGNATKFRTWERQSEIMYD